MIKDRDIKNAVKVLKRGGVVAYPTETAYGLAADSFNSWAIKKIFKIKGRPESKPLPLIAASRSMVKKFFYLNKKEAMLAARYWPGALTLLLKPKKRFPKTLTSKAEKAAVRVSSSNVATALSKGLNRPITATSANVSGGSERYSAFAVSKEFAKRKHKPDMIMEGGILPRTKPSTIAEVHDEKIIILRKGPIKL